MKNLLLVCICAGLASACTVDMPIDTTNFLPSSIVATSSAPVGKSYPTVDGVWKVTPDVPTYAFEAVFTLHGEELSGTVLSASGTAWKNGCELGTGRVKDGLVEFAVRSSATIPFCAAFAGRTDKGQTKIIGVYASYIADPSLDHHPVATGSFTATRILAQ